MKSFEEAIGEGIAAIQERLGSGYEAQMADAVAASEPGPPAPLAEPPPADGEPA